jgi:predicted acylesterase/phospholipase RssA
MEPKTGILLTGEYKWYKVILRFLSFLFKSVWLFFPAILFIVLAIWCFWTLGQGKDIIVAFGENPRAKIYFFLAIALWAYLSWFSSRIVAYQKEYRQWQQALRAKALSFEDIDHGWSVEKSAPAAGPGKPPANVPPRSGADNNLHNYSKALFHYELPLPWLEIFPRILGFACFLVIELALLQLKYYGTPNWSATAAWIFFWALLFVYMALNNRLSRLIQRNELFTRRLFWALLGLFVVLVAVIWLVAVKSLMTFFWLTVLLHIIYVKYVHLRRAEMNNLTFKKTASYKAFHKVSNPFKRFITWLMKLLRLPGDEPVYLIWFIVVAIIGITVYVLAVVYLSIAVNIGPFPLALLAFSVLLGFGNIVTVVSVRTSINWHLVIFLLALFLGSSETHYVRMADQSANRTGIYKQRQPVTEYFDNWINDTARARLIDSSPGHYNIYFVLANGGASRSGYWTAGVLGKLEDATRGTNGWFSKHLFCLSGASGGSVGNATFFALLDSTNKLASQGRKVSFTKAASEYLGNDFLSYTLARMLGPDYFKYIFHFSWLDRAGALENSLEDITAFDTSVMLPNMKSSFASLLAVQQKPYSLPILCINVTRVQDGNPGVVSNIKLDSLNFNNRVDVLDLMPADKDIALSTAAILSARFPYVSPAGRIDQQLDTNNTRAHYFVDGGYFDNSGAGIVQEMIRLINNHVRTHKDPVVKRRASKLRYVILHITNGAVGSAVLQPVSPITNDLAAPLLTMVGAYDMQTTVNDQRLRNLLKDIDSIGPAKAAYYPINLYKSYYEREKDPKTGKWQKEDPYPMNWFISDTMRHRMDKRLQTHARLNQLIQGILSSN